VSPAGAALGVVMNSELMDVYEVSQTERPLSLLATAYARARNADPLSSYGDFISLSDVVDEQTARIIKSEVSDGVIAPGYTEAALALLKSKKGGGYVLIEGNIDYQPPQLESKETFGVAFVQKRNESVDNPSVWLDEVVTDTKEIPEEARRDLLLANLTVKYTQSNSVGYALNGQMIGVGAGQQSRVDCVKLAARKVETWCLRRHPRVMNELRFRQGVKRQDRINARVGFIEGDMTEQEYDIWRSLLELEGPVTKTTNSRSQHPPPSSLTPEEKRSFMTDKLKGVSLASDGFFPFRDSIDQAARRGVKYIVQPGGSVADRDVILACNQYGITMAHSHHRLFHH